MDEPTFRASFPAFWDSAVYPSAQITFWLGIATQEVNSTVWGELTDLGVALYTAHNLVLEGREGSAGSPRRPGAASVGMLSSKSVGGVSASYDTGSVAFAGGGDWNLTTYGVRFLTFARRCGAGPIQTGVLTDMGLGSGYDLAPLFGP